MSKSTPKSVERIMKSLFSNPIIVKHRHCIFTGAELVRRKRIHLVWRNTNEPAHQFQY